MGKTCSRTQQRERLVRSLRASGASWVEVAAALKRRYRFNTRVALRYGHAPSLGNLSKLAELYECAVSDLLSDLPDLPSASRTCAAC